jgi:hypothetical protein
MLERAEFILKCEEILDFVDVYSVLRHEHLEKFFPYSEKVVKYLLKNQRLRKSIDGIHIVANQDSRPDK